MAQRMTPREKVVQVALNRMKQKWKDNAEAYRKEKTNRKIKVDETRSEKSPLNQQPLSTNIIPQSNKNRKGKL